MTDNEPDNSIANDHDRPIDRALDALPVAVVVARDPSCAQLEFNAAAARLFDLDEPLAALQPIGLDKLPVQLMRNGQPVPMEDLPLTSALAGQTPGSAIELDLIRRNGKTVRLLHYAAPMRDEQGRSAGCVGVFVDLQGTRDTKLAREARERFADTLDTLPDPFGILTAVRDNGKIVDFVFQYINLAGAASNHAPREEHLGRRLLEMLPPLKQMGIFDAYARVVETGKPLDQGFVFDFNDGSSKCFEIWASRLGDGIVARWREANDRPAIEATLRESEARLRQMNETLEARVRERTAEANARADQLRDLALDLAESESRERKRFAQLLHDHFQQLVSAAKMRAGIIRRKADAPALRDSVQQIEQLLGQAIDASRSLAAQLSPPVLHDAGLVPGIESVVRSTERDAGLSITFEADPLAEPANERIRLILFECARELLQNVVQHAFSKTARVSVDVTASAMMSPAVARTAKTPTTAIRISVADDGRGFDVNDPKFTQVDDKPFGLLRIRERIHYIGGDVRIDSRHDQGTKIEVIVPAELRREPEKLSLARAASLTEPPISGTGLAQLAGAAGNRAIEAGRVLRVVVADDHRLFRDGLTSLLAHESYLQIVGEAADGDAAIAVVRQTRPDVLICDISMPRKNGVEVTATLSREFPAMRIIGLSMHEREDMANAMRSAGASAYLTKSGPSDLLLGILRTFVQPTGSA